MSEPVRPRSEAYDQRLARLAVRGLVHTPFSPNMVTSASLVVGALAAYLFALGEGMANWGAGVFAVAVWMDHVDGELARTTGTTSEFGHYFDHVAAVTNYAMMFVGAGYGLSVGPFGADLALLGIGAALAVVGIMSLRVYGEQKFGRDEMKQSTKMGFEIEDILYLVAPITWFGFLGEFIFAAGIGAPVFLLYVIWDYFRRSGSEA